MSKTKLFNLLALGAISLGLTACGNEVEHPEQDSQVQEVREETAEHEEVVKTEETLPETEEQEVHEEEQIPTANEVKQEWFATIQEETQHLDYELIEVREHQSLDALLNNEGNGPHLLFQIDMTREEYVTYAVNSKGKAFEDEFDIRRLSEKYSNTLFDLLDSEGYTIYSYENGKPCIEVTDWLGD